MRLFIAINFEESIKDKLCETQEKLKSFALKGNFTLRENLHLTLVFIGEVEPDRASDIKEVMNSIINPPFKLELKGVGAFRRDGGDIWWIGAQKNEALSAIYTKLANGLRYHGFDIENREYRPHLTLAREVKLKDTFNKMSFAQSVPKMNMKISKISLMKSERIDGKLVYSEIYDKKL